MQATLSEQREVYRPLAAKGASMFYVIGDLHTMNSMYHFSLAAFLLLFSQVGCSFSCYTLGSCSANGGRSLPRPMCKACTYARAAYILLAALVGQAADVYTTPGLSAAAECELTTPCLQHLVQMLSSTGAATAQQLLQQCSPEQYAVAQPAVLCFEGSSGVC